MIARANRGIKLLLQQSRTASALRAFVLGGFLMTGLPARGSDVEWRVAFGMHEMTVPQADHSHTYGLDLLLSAETTHPSGIHWLVSGEALLDRDQDCLDPDHIPVWWRLHGGIDGPIARRGPWEFSWTGDFDNRSNTVGGIECELRALPGLAVTCQSGPFTGAIKAGAGFYFLELDDDVPRERGYGRDDCRHRAFAGSLGFDAALELRPGWKLQAHAQQWRDEDGWLQSQYRAELRCAVNARHPDQALALSVEFDEYNLAPYAPGGATGSRPPILPWNRDRLIKLSYHRRW